MAPRVADHRRRPVGVHRRGDRLHDVLLFPARAALAHPAECRGLLQRGHGLLGQLGRLPGQQLSAGARGRIHPQLHHQQAVVAEQDLRADHGAGRAADGRDCPGAVEFAGAAGGGSQAALDRVAFADHGDRSRRRRGLHHGPAAYRRTGGKHPAAPADAGASARDPVAARRADPARAARFPRLAPAGGLRGADRGDLDVGQLRRHHRGEGPGNRPVVSRGRVAAHRPGIEQRAALHSRVRGHLPVRGGDRAGPLRRQPRRGAGLYPGGAGDRLPGGGGVRPAGIVQAAGDEAGSNA